MGWVLKIWAGLVRMTEEPSTPKCLPRETPRSERLRRFRFAIPAATEDFAQTCQADRIARAATMWKEMAHR